MTKILFSLMGFDVSLKTLLKAAAAIALAGLIYFAYDSIKDHFRYIANLEKANEQLSLDVAEAEGQRDAVILINEQNREAAALQDDIESDNQAIAASERGAARARAQTYQEIRNAIIKTPKPSPDTPQPPVPPVITDTLGRLWDDDEGASTGEGGDSDGDGIR